MIQDATDEQVKEFLTDFITMLKARDPELYEEAECWLYKELYGCHFNVWMLDKAVAHMVNEDGTTGPHWTVEQTTKVAHNYDIKFDTFNEYDWNYVMNMIYSDYYGSISNSVDSYVNMASKFLMDKDAPEGKAFKYYKAMH